MDLRDAILNAEDTKIVKHREPRWGVTVGLKELTMEQLEDIQRTTLKEGEQDYDLFNMKMILSCVVDPKTGETIFTEADIASLKKRNHKAMEKLSTEIMKLNRADEAALEEAVKN